MLSEAPFVIFHVADGQIKIILYDLRLTVTHKVKIVCEEPGVRT
jgi:hypothetical protein